VTIADGSALVELFFEDSKLQEAKKKRNRRTVEMLKITFFINSSNA